MFVTGDMHVKYEQPFYDVDDFQFFVFVTIIKTNPHYLSNEQREYFQFFVFVTRAGAKLEPQEYLVLTFSSLCL